MLRERTLDEKRAVRHRQDYGQPAPWRALMRGTHVNRGGTGILSRQDRSFWAFTLPALLVFLVIVQIPFIIGIGYSFTDWDGVSSSPVFIGLQNYRLLAGDERAITSLSFTVRFTFVVVIIANLLGFLLALGLTKGLPGTKVMRVVFFLPNIIGGLILGFLWRFVLIQGFQSIGKTTGWEFFQTPWLGDPLTGFWGSVVVFVWKTAGYLMIIYIAALLSIDKSLLEAAEIDGAGGMQKLFHIKVPLLFPAFTVCLFLMLSWAMKLFDVIFALTNGAPYGSTEIFALNIYKEAFVYNNYGYGSAKAVVFFIFVAAVTTLQVWATKRKEVQL
jgi:raffinose/stachyose/melibiose transport system permease protein